MESSVRRVNVNLLGLEIKWNGKYIRKEDCFRTQESIHHRITELDEHISKRLDDIKDLILKNGK